MNKELRQNFSVSSIMEIYILFSFIIIFNGSVSAHPIGESLISDKVFGRYGSHKIEECTKFDLAFLCIRKCIDLDFEIAHADKKCRCTCHHNKIKSKYMNKQTNVTKWRLGAPTTKLPYWAEAVVAKNGQDLNDDDSYSDVHNESDDKSVQIDEIYKLIKTDKTLGVNETLNSLSIETSVNTTSLDDKTAIGNTEATNDNTVVTDTVAAIDITDVANTAADESSSANAENAETTTQE